MNRAWSTFTPPLTTRNIIVLAALMVLAVFLLQADTGFNLADEGYLWYGTIRTALGEIPMRDFQSYEPGRYYWGALWFKLLRNDGILALRLSQAVFQFVGLSLALLLLRRLLGSWIVLIFAAVILVRWMFPTWKIYEPVILIAAIYFAVFLIEQPSRTRHLVAGIFVGFAAFFGRNHGLYGGIAFLLLTFYFGWTSERRVLLQRLGALALGIVIGYSPMLFMFAFAPELFTRFTTEIVFNLRNGTNLPLPVPWPWRAGYQSLAAREAVNVAAIGTLYIAILTFYVLAFGRLFFFRRTAHEHPVFVASAFLGLAYLHYTFARPQLYYLAWTIPPFILGLFALPSLFSGQLSRRVAVVAWVILGVFSISALEMAPENYFTVKPRAFLKTKLYGGDFNAAMNSVGLIKTDVRGDRLWVLSDTAGMIETARAFEQNLIKPNEQILVAPYLPGLYAVMRKRSPLWEIYFLLPRPLEEQEAMAKELEDKQVTWALVCSHYVDNRPELQFGSTHGRVMLELVANFEVVRTEETSHLDRNCVLMRRKSTSLPNASQ